jgi:hypothetical protein
MHRYTFPHRIYAEQVPIFGKENTQWSRGFKWFNNYVNEKHGHLLTNNLAYWFQYIPEYAQSIQLKMEEFRLFITPPATNCVFGFIDNTLRRTCRPGGDARFDPEIQEAFYCGWKKCHSLKWQTVDLPNGMTADMSGPLSGRRSDLKSLADSNINQRISALQVGNAKQYVIYGDSIYPVMSHLRKRHQNHPNSIREIFENEIMKKIRVSIECNYGQTSNLFQYVDWRKNCKVLAGGSNIALCYKIATLLKNISICVNQTCVTAEYFNCSVPTLEDYMHEML